MKAAQLHVDELQGDAGRPIDGRVRPADLTGSQRHLRAALSALARTAESFSRGARRAMPFLLRQRVRLDLGEPAIGNLSESDAAEHGPCYAVSLTEKDGPAWATLLLNGPCLARLLEGSLGNSQVSEGASLGDRLTLAQRVLIAKIASRLGEDYAEAIHKETGLKFQVSGGTAIGQDEEEESESRDGLFIEMNFAGDGTNASIVLAISADAVDDAVREADDTQLQKGDPKVAEALQNVEIQVTAELGRLSLGLRKIVGLKEGYVLRLPTLIESPIAITLGGVQKFQGVPVTSRGQLAVEILDIDAPSPEGGPQAP
ncbi:MAG: hypothetical protein B6A08_05955 [Sorangiineae bacterium NIC37A_2]|jgi:flagellar motor switch protein FliM|nr:MAG: hypothetical protein B6A08_05955 [Sorangiineae bacterium NIC37A_2]